MNKTILTILFLFSISLTSKSQIICIYCFDQSDSISDNVNNLILNGGFESGCGNIGFFCPASASYNCNITDWTCVGGGPNTYANTRNQSPQFLCPQGQIIAYFGNAFCQLCSPVSGDTSCMVSADCSVGGIPAGYPTTDINLGGSQGVSLEQTVNGLTINSTYVLEFWAGGEGGFPVDGLFGVDVGFGDTLLRNSESQVGQTGRRYIIEFNAVNPSHTIKFTNWGHICSDCTELVLDDVRLYPLADLDTSVGYCSLLPMVAFTAPNDICPGTCTNFTNLTVAGTTYQWSFPGGVPAVSTDDNPQNICYNTPGFYPVTLIATNANGSDTLTLNNYIHVYPSPPGQGITQSGDTLIAIAGATSYQWYFNGSIIPGATEYFYLATASGDYNVVATDNNGCEVEAVIFNVFASVKEVSGDNQLIVHPNPAGDEIEISFLENIITAGRLTAKIISVPGETVQLLTDIDHATGSKADVSSLSQGIYFLEVENEGRVFRTKFLKQ